jgi:hypothetical protein
VLTLNDIVANFTAGLIKADSNKPIWISRTGRSYQPGIGPHPEDRAVDLILESQPGLAMLCRTRILYPDSKNRCDLVLVDSFEWWIEVKMARFVGDNGLPDDTAIKDILSPYVSDRSALTDCIKLRSAPSIARKAILIYAFDWLPKRPALPAISAFEVLAQQHHSMIPSVACSFDSLVHPVHTSGFVKAWEILS